MLILKIITSNCSDRDIRQLARCLAGQAVWPACRLYSQPVVFDYTQCGCDIQEQVDTKNDLKLDKCAVKSHGTGWDLGLMGQ